MQITFTSGFLCVSHCGELLTCIPPFNSQGNLMKNTKIIPHVTYHKEIRVGGFVQTVRSLAKDS